MPSNEVASAVYQATSMSVATLPWSRVSGQTLRKNNAAPTTMSTDRKAKMRSTENKMLTTGALGRSLTLAADPGGAGTPTANVKAPSMMCASADTTRQLTTYASSERAGNASVTSDAFEPACAVPVVTGSPLARSTRIAPAGI